MQMAGAMVISLCILAALSQIVLWLRNNVCDRSVWWLYIRTLTLEPTILPRHFDQNATRILLTVWTLVRNELPSHWMIHMNESKFVDNSREFILFSQALLVISQGINSDIKTSLIIQTPHKRIHTLEEIAQQTHLKPYLPTILLPLFMVIFSLFQIVQPINQWNPIWCLKYWEIERWFKFDQGDQRPSMETIAARARDMGSLINADALGSPEVRVFINSNNV